MPVRLMKTSKDPINVSGFRMLSKVPKHICLNADDLDDAYTWLLSAIRESE
jgi:hypothetical protein